ncbi:hypothetical protein BGZ46_004710 [Entomortierella lignicola]|nr:hypothetical protein BGZ46_004710 [Entomortierella lignicola]
MKVNFRLHDQPNSVQTVYVPSCNTLVQHVRVLAAEGVDAKPEQLRLIYAGKQLHDTQTLFQCSFRDADTILVMLRNIPALPQPNTLDKVSSNDFKTASTFSTSSKSVEAENQIGAKKNSEDTEEEQTYFCDIAKITTKRNV